MPRRRIIKKIIENKNKEYYDHDYTIIESGDYKIPKIIHQMWIGPKQMPYKMMETWKEKHPDYEYIIWTEEEIKNRSFVFECQNRIDETNEIVGKVDIMRWEILYKYGGIFLDADSICINKLDDHFLRYEGFASYENEKIRKDLIAVGTMGFKKNHQIPLDAINHIKNNPVSPKITGKSAWQTVGPTLLTNLYNKNKYHNFNILPSYLFLPKHYTKTEYQGPGKIYAYQEWGSTLKKYDNMDTLSLEPKYNIPYDKVSILIPSYNTKKEFLLECLKSIRNQEGKVFKEIVWIDDGSDEENRKIIKNLLYNFEKKTMFCKVVYSENENNKGLGFTLNKGVKLCSHEIILRMDSDDIMVENRIIKQVEYMKNNPDIKICGAQIKMFDSNRTLSKTNHPNITWDDFKKKRPSWFINHPTMCYRKSAVLDIGNYKKDLKVMVEDYEFLLRMLKKYKVIHNIPEVLLKYRVHESQVTFKGNKDPNKWHNIRNKLIDDIID